MAEATFIRITKIVAPDELGEQLEPRMNNLGNAIGRRMQRLVPKKTWDLHDTITVATERKGARVKVQVGVGSEKVDYGLAVERGTSKQAAQPYMTPALLQSRAGDLVNEAPLGKQHGHIEPKKKPKGGKK